MNRTSISWIAPLLLLAATATAQQTPVTQDTLWTSGNGKFESAPDTALVQFLISVQQPELKAAYVQAQASAKKIRQTLRDNGIDPMEAEISFFSMTPVYKWDPKRKLVGFQVNSHVTIKVHDFTKLGPIIDGFSQLDTTDGLSISYTLENIEAAKVEDAYRTAHRNAEVLARAAGRTLGLMSYASVDANDFNPQPRPVMRMAAKASALAEESPVAEFAPAKVTMTAHVNVLFQIK